MNYAFVFHDRSNSFKAFTLEDLKPYMTLDFEHVYKDFDDNSNSKNTKIKMRECTDSDFNRTAWTQNIWS